jgi:hypothetical protein
MKRCLIATCVCFLIGWASAQTPAESRKVLTMGRLAEILIPALNLENQLPKTFVRLTSAETCRVECAVLMNNGLAMFAGAECERCVTRTFLAEVVFELCSRHLNLKADDANGKLALLVGRQIIPPGDPNECLTEEDALAVLNQPQVNESIAAFVAERPVPGTQKTDPISDPYASYRLRNVTEGPLSPISPTGKK